MDKRGVTRPMSGMSKEHGHSMAMNTEDRYKMLKKHHKNTLWIYWAVILLGFWMLTTPLTFDYSLNPATPAGDRPVWLSMADRLTAMKWSDIISGALLVLFGWRSLRPNRPYSLWMCCAIGFWISVAPFIFWSPSSVAYLNGTFVGALVIALTILIPGMPNMIMFMKMGGNVPRGWTYNPSSWPQRWIMISLAFAGWLFSRYLGAYQLGYTTIAWDPFFGSSTAAVLTSDMSRSWPISDAALGTFAYTLEFLMGWMGSTSRWRTMPWMVTFFGILIIPLGFVSIFLVISQPLTVGAWCSICLLTAIIMLPMIPLQVDEVVAMGQHMVERKRKGDSMWKVFWKGGEALTDKNDERSPELIQLNEKPGKILKASIWGMSTSWQLALSTVLGLWLMFAPGSFGVGIETTEADINHLGGALVVVVAVVCMAEVLRAGRYLNILIGLAIAILPWLISGQSTGLAINNTIIGIAVAVLSVPRGPIYEQYGLWHKYIR